MTKCELCGSEVKVVGKTTLHYEPIVVRLPKEKECFCEDILRLIRCGNCHYNDALADIKQSLEEQGIKVGE